MITEEIIRLEKHLQEIPYFLKNIRKEELIFKPSENKWSKQEIFGHLIDSATNNLSRFIRAQFEDNPNIHYDQDKCCECNFYQKADLNHLIVLWESLNKQLLFIWKQLNSEVLMHKANGHSLAFLANDYIQHLEHHLNQIK